MSLAPAYRLHPFLSFFYLFISLSLLFFFSTTPTPNFPPQSTYHLPFTTLHDIPYFRPPGFCYQPTLILASSPASFLHRHP